jgi:hypothetical protein
MKQTIWVFSIEPLETRYTAQWHEHIPELLRSAVDTQTNVIQIDGIQKNTIVTPGAFLNFSDTNYWKSSQLCNFLDYYNRGETTINDQFLFTDAWNPIIIQLRYMSDLLNLNWKFHGLFHAGSWDSHDFLGRLIGNKDWVKHTEKAIFHALDHNYFATDFHINMFCWNLLNSNGSCVEDWLDNGKIIRTGWPMEYMEDTLAPYKNLVKRDLILFPHRIAPEKQVEIFRDLALSLPQYEFVVCQDNQLSKHEYHTLLGESKMVFSASKQETYGISTGIEGPVLGTIPLIPERLSYSEMFDNTDFLYPSEWTETFDLYKIHKQDIIDKIIDVMSHYDTYRIKLEEHMTRLKKYSTATDLINNLIRN